MAKAKVQIEPLREGALKQTILRMRDIDDDIEALELERKGLAEKVLATMHPKDVRQYDRIRTVIVQAMRRTVGWREEAAVLARKLYPTRDELNAWLRYLVKKYPRKATKPFVKITEVKESES